MSEQDESDLPENRGACPTFRPCPYVSCRYHLFLDVGGRSRKTLKFNSTRDIEELSPSCSLDVAEEGTHTLSWIGDRFGITRERVRQIERSAMAKLDIILVEADTDARSGLMALLKTIAREEVFESPSSLAVTHEQDHTPDTTSDD